jgi:hypothetical protein
MKPRLYLLRKVLSIDSEVLLPLQLGVGLILRTIHPLALRLGAHEVSHCASGGVSSDVVLSVDTFSAEKARLEIDVRNEIIRVAPFRRARFIDVDA